MTGEFVHFRLDVARESSGTCWLTALEPLASRNRLFDVRHRQRLCMPAYSLLRICGRRAGRREQARPIHHDCFRIAGFGRSSVCWGLLVRARRRTCQEIELSPLQRVPSRPAVVVNPERICPDRCR